MSIEIQDWVESDIPVVSGWITDRDTRKALGIPLDSTPAAVETGLWLALADRQQKWFIARDDDELMGMFGLTSINPDGSAIFHLVIAPEHRGKGGFVSRKARSFMQERGVRKLIALISRDNKKSKKLAEGFGFKFEDVDLGVLLLNEEG